MQWARGTLFDRRVHSDYRRARTFSRSAVKIFSRSFSMAVPLLTTNDTVLAGSLPTDGLVEYRVSKLSDVGLRRYDFIVSQSRFSDALRF
jgi:hypothetical protein